MQVRGKLKVARSWQLDQQMSGGRDRVNQQATTAMTRKLFPVISLIHSGQSLSFTQDNLSDSLRTLSQLGANSRYQYARIPLARQDFMHTQAISCYTCRLVEDPVPHCLLLVQPLGSQGLKDLLCSPGSDPSSIVAAASAGWTVMTPGQVLAAARQAQVRIGCLAYCPKVHARYTSRFPTPMLSRHPLRQGI